MSALKTHCCRPNGADLEASREMLDLILEHLPQRYPEHFSTHSGSDGRVSALTPLGTIEDVGRWREQAPLHLAGNLVQEDLIMIRNEGDQTHRVSSGYVVFSFGRVGERIGMDLQQIHQNVNRFPSDLNKPSPDFRQGSSRQAHLEKNLVDLVRLGPASESLPIERPTSHRPP